MKEAIMESYILKIYIKKLLKVMHNHYLHINKENGKIEINSSDNVFSSIVRRENKEGFDAYCDEKAHEWLASKLGNYSAIPMKHRKIIADKWLAAKNLPEGNYDYYFNLDTIDDIFRKEVDSIAKKLRISNYTLKMNS